MPEKADGMRILVDRLWPRGLSKSKAGIDLWMKEIAPSDGLRKWFAHDPKKWIGFKKQYEEELKGKKSLLKQVRDGERKNGTVTLLFSAKDTAHNNACVLAEQLKRR